VRSFEDFLMHSAKPAGDVVKRGAQSPGRLRQLFHALSDHGAGEHEALLHSMDATTQERRAVHALLQSKDKQSFVLETPVLDLIRKFEDNAVSEKEIRGRHVGDFTLEEVIGRGGSAVVFRAREVGGERRMAAVKVIHKGLYSPNGQRRFEREAEILAQLKHPSIAALLDFGVTTWGTPYLALEHVEGTDIVSYANLHALTQRQRVAMLARVCNALNAAHAQHIIHRDIKPGNILVTVTGEVKLVDFGIGRRYDDHDATATIEVALTPSYAAPEQYEGSAAHPSADVYSLGVLASELLLGVRLGPDSTWPKHSIAAVANQRWHRMPRALKHILSTSLKSVAELRYQSAGELACAFEAYLSNRTRPAMRAGSNKVFDLVLRMRPSLSAGLVPVATFFLGVLVCALWMSQTGSHRMAPSRNNDRQDASATHDDLADKSSDPTPAVASIVKPAFFCSNARVPSLTANGLGRPAAAPSFLQRCTANITPPVVGSQRQNSSPVRSDASS
jgi:eukaryotic-like serine/threonine-protein kinase